ncbi:MAG: ybhF 2 [Firmicutes bacterium]|nr:ybhF 2 [Bacillota bacterium]
MIQISNLTKFYGRRKALDDISLSIEQGEIFGLVGPDSAGKTSMIRILAGLLTPSSGQVTVLGASDLESIKESIGYVPQKFSLYGDLTVMENIRLMGSLYGQNEQSIMQRATETLGFTDLLPFKDRLTEQLSGGMKQKLALAAGLMHQPKIFFLDEPTAGVDPVSRREFWQILFQINRAGTTVFVSTSYMDEAELCNRIAFLHHGRIVACDAPDRLKENYPYKVLEMAVTTRGVKKYLTQCGLIDINAFGDKYHLIVKNISQSSKLVNDCLLSAGIPIVSLTEVAPSLEDVFVAMAGEVK